MRMQPLKREEAAPTARPFFDEDVQTWGKVLNSTGIYAYCPPLLAASRQLTVAISQCGSIDRQLQALINLRVAELVRCPS